VRLGSLPVGIYPTESCRKIEIDGEGLKPSLTATSIISFIKHVKAGECVGDGMHYTSETSVKVAILPVGYGDGYPRLTNQGYVLIGGKKAPIVGGVTLDTMMINISELPEANIGDEVILMGQQGEETITAIMIAEWAGTVTYDIMCRWGDRMDRVSI
jgi:alanine racemase